MYLTQGLSSLIRNKPISQDDLFSAALFTLDAVATAYAGRNTVAGKIILEWAKQAGGDAGRQAFVMGALTHITETDDLHRASVTHPGCVVVPAALAVGERDQCSGQEILRAILHGFEAMCRIGSSVGPAHYRIWHNTATCGPFGSAQAVASLRGLSLEQTVNALGNAGTQSSGLWQFMETGAMSKHLHAGRAAESGLLAADLAMLGLTGPAAILEGEKGIYKAMCADPVPEAVLDDPDDLWQLRQTSIKPWPSCRHTHPAIDAALEVHSKLNGAGIERIHVGTYQAALDVCDRPDPDSEYTAKFSLYHCVAVALQYGEVGLHSFTPEYRKVTSQLRAAMNVQIAEPYYSNYPKAWGSSVRVLTTAGVEIEVERINCKGDPELPLDDGEMRRKAMGLFEYGGLSEDRAAVICDSILNLPESRNTPSLLADFLKGE